MRLGKALLLCELKQTLAIYSMERLTARPRDLGILRGQKITSTISNAKLSPFDSNDLDNNTQLTCAHRDLYDSFPSGQLPSLPSFFPSSFFPEYPSFFVYHNSTGHVRRDMHTRQFAHAKLLALCETTPETRPSRARPVSGAPKLQKSFQWVTPGNGQRLGRCRMPKTLVVFFLPRCIEMAAR